MPAEPTYLDLDVLPTFRFRVEIGDIGAVGIFTECKLPDIEWDIQELKEGGLNDYIHQLPGQRKAAKVSLKQGLTKKPAFMKWYGDMMKEDFTKYLRTVTITLLDPVDGDLMVWNLFNAFPTKIIWPELKTSDNVVAVQSLELACGRIEFEPNPS